MAGDNSIKSTGTFEGDEDLNTEGISLCDGICICGDEINRGVDNILSIDDFTKNIDSVEKYEDFARFKSEINNYLIDYFNDRLNDKNDDFKLAFTQGNISKYQLENEEEKLELKLLIKGKNKIYQEIILKSIIRGKLDNILSAQEKNDLKIILKSGIFSYMDDIYINWLNETEKIRDKNIENKINLQTPDNKLVYGGIKDGNFVGYGEFLKDIELKIDDININDIKNENIRKYLSLFSTFIKQGITNYNIWVETEVFELNTWKDRESIFGLITPIEDYNYQEVLVEPELILFLKDKEKAKGVNLADFYGLSEDFFGERFGMDNITLDFVETILEGGESTFSGFIGKAFPNDKELSEREGNSILVKNTDMLEIVENSKKGFSNLFGKDFIFNSNKLYEELIKEVKYHEFGHSIFIKGHPYSKLEEAKATLFYYLQIFNENQQKEYFKQDISKVVEFTIMDSIRNLERIKQEKSLKYLILTKINLMYLFSSELVTWDNDKLIINSDNDKFNNFLNQLKDMLFHIKDLYELDEDELKQKENLILEELDNIIMPTINKMIKIINK